MSDLYGVGIRQEPRVPRHFAERSGKMTQKSLADTDVSARDNLYGSARISRRAWP